MVCHGRNVLSSRAASTLRIILHNKDAFFPFLHYFLYYTSIWYHSLHSFSVLHVLLLLPSRRDEMKWARKKWSDALHKSFMLLCLVLLFYCTFVFLTGKWEYEGAFGFLCVKIHAEHAGYVLRSYSGWGKWRINCLWTFLDLIIEAMSALEMEMNWFQG